MPFSARAWLEVTENPPALPSRPVVQFDDGGGPSFVRLKLSRIPRVGNVAGALGEADDDGLVEAEGETLRLSLALGLTLREALLEGESERLGLGDCDDEGL